MWCIMMIVQWVWYSTSGKSMLAYLNYLSVCHAARIHARPGSKRTAVGIQKPQTGVLDFLEGTRYDTDLLRLHHMNSTD